MPSDAQLTLDSVSEGSLRVRMAGEWKIGHPLPSSSEVVNRLGETKTGRSVVFDTAELGEWDSGLLTFLISVSDFCAQKGIHVDLTGLPEGARRLLALASAVPERAGARKTEKRVPFLQLVGTNTLEYVSGGLEMLAFIGESLLTLAVFVRGKARFRRVDFITTLQDCGAQALPVVSLISVLIGLILAFVGAAQLQMFGAQIYVADLVGIGIAWEMGAMMTGIIMSGRTSAAFAAQLGTMQVNEEIDALQTLGISPMEFLVLPRMLALILMMPLLCVYADLLGILGGATVSVAMYNLSPLEFYNELTTGVHLIDFGIGLFKSVVFGIIVALSGCLRGIQCGRSASAVGAAATSAVVTSIVMIIVADSIITTLSIVLHIR